MKCPICVETDLVMSDRQGVEIDYCPQCRGVWLDRGEQDKIIERSVSQEKATALSIQSGAPVPPAYTPPYDSHSYHHGHHGQSNPSKSWLGDLVD